MMFKLIFPLFFLLLTNAVHATESTHNVDPQLQASLAAFFAAKPTAHHAVAKLEAVQRWPNAKGEVRWSLPRLRHLPRRISLIAEQGQGKTLHRWYVPIHVKWMANVITLQQNVSARTMLDESMVIKKQQNIAGLRGQVLFDAKDISGLRSLQNIFRGDVILSTMVKRPPLIKRGDHVTILVNTAGIKIRVSGVALKSGSRGDRMLVQNSRSKQTLQSIVEDAHTVSIQVGGV